MGRLIMYNVVQNPLLFIFLVDLQVLCYVFSLLFPFSRWVGRIQALDEFSKRTSKRVISKHISGFCFCIYVYLVVFLHLKVNNTQ